MIRQRSWSGFGVAVSGAILLLAGVVGPGRAESLEFVQTIALKGKAGKLDHAVLDAKRQRLLVANTVNNTLDVVDLKEGKLLKQVRNQQGIQGIAYAADLDRVFVGLGTGGFCNAFDGEELKLLKTVKFGDEADNVRYNPSTHLVSVAHAEKSLGVLDAKTFEVKADVKLAGDAEGFVFDPAKPRVYVNVPSANHVAVIDTDKNEVTTTYPLKMAGNNTPLALDEANHRLLVGCRKEPAVVVVDSDSGKELSKVEIPKDVDDLSFDAKNKRAYASCGEGFVAVLKQTTDADHYELLEKIATAPGAGTSYFDAEGGRLYVLVPRQEGKEAPEVRVFQVKP